MNAIRFFTGVAVVVIVVLLFSLPAYAQEAKVTKKDVPASVMAAFQKSFPTAKVKGCSKEKEGDRDAYEIESMVGTVHHDVSYYADGTLIEDEESIKAAELPDAVRKSIQAAYPKGRILSAEKLTRPAGVGYETIIKSGKKTYEVEFDAAGKVVNTEEETGKVEKSDSPVKKKIGRSIVRNT